MRSQRFLTFAAALAIGVTGAGVAVAVAVAAANATFVGMTHQVIGKKRPAFRFQLGVAAGKVVVFEYHADYHGAVADHCARYDTKTIARTTALPIAREAFSGTLLLARHPDDILTVSGRFHGATSVSGSFSETFSPPGAIAQCATGNVAFTASST